MSQRVTSPWSIMSTHQFWLMGPCGHNGTIHLPIMSIMVQSLSRWKEWYGPKIFSFNKVKWYNEQIFVLKFSSKIIKILKKKTYALILIHFVSSHLLLSIHRYAVFLANQQNRFRACFCTNGQNHHKHFKQRSYYFVQNK